MAGDEGFFRRRILLLQEQHRVVAALEDDFHAFAVVISHDGDKVTDVNARAIRYPLTTCAGAVEPLRGFRGMRLSPDSRAVGAVADARMNCTHLFDLTGLAIAHACREQLRREYDISIADSSTSVMDASLKVDGREQLGFLIRDGVIEAPSPFAGQRIGQGFSAWVQRNVEDPERREAALVLQRGCFVAGGRRHREQIARAAGGWSAIRPGACYSHQPERLTQAVRIADSFRDFSRDEWRLLSFLED
jgi:hypothetical protein